MGCYVAPSVLDQNCKNYSQQFSHHENGTAMKQYAFPVVQGRTVEKCHGASEWLQKGNRCSFVHEGELSGVMAAKAQLTAPQVAYYSTSEGTVALSVDGISLALDKRVALFFQQAVLCYKMSDFVFSTGGADAQIGTSPAIKLGSAPSVTLKREAAHSSTIPTLIAHARDGSTPNGLVYLKGGGSYHDHNATVGMPECVNGADELIDGNGKDGKLRDTAIKILNLVAQGLDPVQATKDFCKAFEKQVHDTAQPLPAQESRRLVLGLYEQQITEIKQGMAHNPLFFDQLLGVIVHSSHPQEEKLRKAVYQKRYDMIRFQQVVESRIAKRIEAMKAQMSTNDKSFLEYMLLKAFSETQESKIIEKLLGKTAAYFEKENPSTPLKTFKTRVENLLAKYHTPLNNLMRYLRADFRELSCAEFTYRAGIFRNLRVEVNNWFQKDFQRECLEKTGTKVSRSWVGRMEELARIPTKSADQYKTPINQRRKYVTLANAELAATTFDVPVGIFLPCLFTS